MQQRTHESPRRWGWGWGVGLALAAGVIAIYGQTLAFDFVGFDDDLYVTDNPIMREGLSRAGLVYAFSKGKLQDGTPFHPFTWLSHMLDVELFGFNAGGHHASNLLLHLLASLLFFVTLRTLTGATWRSAAAAALWAWHPLRVESVAWISERKDVLSGVFAMLTLLCYARYARSESRGAWWAMIASFAVGLLAKPTLVPLPFALLLLDVWPLARKRSLGQLVLEKVPLFALSALSSALTVYYHLGWVAPIASLSPLQRAASAIVAVARYLEQLLWPRNLAPLYPHPYLPTQGGVGLEAVTIAVSAALLVGITLGALRARRQPALAVGWFWFLGMLVPTIGIVQAGNQAHADRYTYLPMLGLCIALVWGLAALFARVRRPALRRLLGAAAGCVLVGYGVAAFVQTRTWRESETFFRHAVAVNPRATEMQLGLAGWLRLTQRFEESAAHYRIALALNPGNGLLHFDLGRSLHALGRTQQAIEEYRLAAASNPPDLRAPYQLGVTYEIEGRLVEAVEQYRRAAELDPENPKPRQRLAAVTSRLGGR